MKAFFKHLTTFKVGKIYPSQAILFLCIWCMLMFVYQQQGVEAADNANVPDYSTLYLNNCPHAQCSEGWWSGTTFEGETVVSIVIGESRDMLEWDRIIWDYQTSTIGTWASGGAYDYRDLIYDTEGYKDTFYASIGSSVVGGEWWIHAYEVDGR